jgi:hypothetical protein
MLTCTGHSPSKWLQRPVHEGDGDECRWTWDHNRSGAPGFLAGDDGFEVRSAATTLKRNATGSNSHYGIVAVPSVTDAGTQPGVRERQPGAVPAASGATDHAEDHADEQGADRGRLTLATDSTPTRRSNHA